MEKTKNKFYKAAAIIEFVLGGIFTLSVLFVLTEVLSSNNAVYELFEEEIQAGTLSIADLDYMRTLLTTTCVMFVACLVVFIITGAFLLKYSNLTDEEASKCYGKCIAWVVVSYIFGGTLIGILATIGLVNIQAKQRERFLKGEPSISENNEKKKEEDKYSLENIEKMQQRLIILKELKDNNNLTEEEYNALRNEVVIKEEKAVDNDPNELSVDKINKLAERLKKIDDLKERGALTEEEYNNLREKIINSRD